MFHFTYCKNDFALNKLLTRWQFMIIRSRLISHSKSSYSLHFVSWLHFSVDSSWIHIERCDVLTEWPKTKNITWYNVITAVIICQRLLPCDITVVTDIILYVFAKWCHRGSVIDPAAFLSALCISAGLHRRHLAVGLPQHRSASSRLSGMLPVTDRWLTHCLKSYCKVAMMAS